MHRLHPAETRDFKLHVNFHFTIPLGSRALRFATMLPTDVGGFSPDGKRVVNRNLRAAQALFSLSLSFLHHVLRGWLGSRISLSPTQGAEIWIEAGLTATAP